MRFAGREIGRRRVTTVTVLVVFMNLATTAESSVEYVTDGSSCSPDQQRNSLASVIPCQARETLIDLKQHMPNVSNVLHIIPDVATVRRCGGSCDLYSHRCVPTANRTKRLEVMVVLSEFPRVQTRTECGYVEVEEHLGCDCDCPVQPHDCRPEKQYYDMSSCRCLCQEQSERNQCILRDMQWDPVNCMCMCPVASWQVCSTGYVFDMTNTCRCVPTSMTASVGLLVAVIVLLTCVVVSFVGGYLMYKNQIGVFRIRSRRGTATSGSNAAAAAVRNGGGGHKNLSHYDLVKEDFS